MSVFLDTSAAYAFLVGTDAAHQDVARAFRDVLEGGRELVTTNYVVVETTALLQHRVGLEAVRAFHDRVLPLARLVFIEPALHRRAYLRLMRADRRGLSLVDCSSFEVMEAEGLRDALAVDADFEGEGFAILV